MEEIQECSSTESVTEAMGRDAVSQPGRLVCREEERAKTEPAPIRKESKGEWVER